MSLGRALLDTAVFVYAIGVDHPYREACRLLLEPNPSRGFRAEASVQAVQELLHQRTRRTGDRASAAQAAEEAASFCVLHDLTVDDLLTGLRLYTATPRLDARDALHAATALNRGIDTIISSDTAFDDVVGLRRLDPVAAAHELEPR